MKKQVRDYEDMIESFQLNLKKKTEIKGRENVINKLVQKQTLKDTQKTPPDPAPKDAEIDLLGLEVPSAAPAPVEVPRAAAATAKPNDDFDFFDALANREQTEKQSIRFN